MPNKIKFNDKSEKKIYEIIGRDLYEQLTKSEIRKLKSEIGKSVDPEESKILRDIMKRCPHLTDAIQSIVKKKRKSDNISESPRKRRKVIHYTYDESDKSEETDEDYEDETSEDPDELINDVNDLHDDYIDEGHVAKLNMNTEQKNKYNRKLKNVRDVYEKNIVKMHDIIMGDFDDNDNVWFYRNIKMLEKMDIGMNKFELEDNIRKKYEYLTSLKKNGLYENYRRDRNIIKDIIESKHSDQVKQIMLNKMSDTLTNSNEEYQKALDWLHVVLNLPTETKKTNNNLSNILNRLHKNLKNHLYGMENVTLHLLKTVCAIMTDSENNGSIMALVGPPGVGKTTICNLIAESIGFGYGHISCGSINDRATIMGHNSTYIGSKPGLFTQILTNTGQTNNVIVLDEMDKMPDKKFLPIFLQVLDKSQNDKFRDEFCPEINIDLSKNMYILSANTLDNFDEALKNRLKIINIDGYNVEDKIEICISHIIPKIMKRTGVKLKINKDLIKRCILKISPTISGVRDLERFFGDIYEYILLIKTVNIDEIRTGYGNLKNIKIIDANLIKSLTGTEI